MPEGGIFIIPVRFEECDVPFSLSRYQWVDLFDEAGHEKMMGALRLRASQLERTKVEISPDNIEEGESRVEYSFPKEHEHEREEKPEHKRIFSIIIGIILVLFLASPWGIPKLFSMTPSNKSSPTPTNIQDGSVNRLDQVEKATIQIEAQSTFVDPEFGQQLNNTEQSNKTGRGSGFIIDPSGIAVTNNHVVAGAALIKVWVGGETNPRNAKVLGLSECSDLAVIQIEEGNNFSALNWYQDDVKSGLEVYAAGFPLGESEYHMTKGIVSTVNANGETNWASIKTVIGHDATINPGSSGGPLVTQNGEVVGVNYRGRPDTNQYFAIGTDTALPIIEELKAGNDVDSIGVNGTAVLSKDGSLSGIWVSSVKSGSPADKAGDIIYQLEGLTLATDGTMKDYCDIIRSYRPSESISVSVIRFSTGEILEGQLNGRELEVTSKF